MSYILVYIFDCSSNYLSDNQFYFVGSLFSVVLFYLCIYFIDTSKGIKHNWRVVLLASLAIIDAFFLASFLISFFFNGLLDPMLYLYWESEFSWRVIYSSIELLLILELAYNGIIYLYSFIHHCGSGVYKLPISNNKKAQRL